ncbi:MAG: hypothetical protein AAGU27_20495 [Dehalobacterium sp.]
MSPVRGLTDTGVSSGSAFRDNTGSDISLFSGNIASASPRPAKYTGTGSFFIAPFVEINEEAAQLSSGSDSDVSESAVILNS